ncbi:MAG: FtsX-like permease family protein, partial [Acidobacteria bacterium]|nr:FtsX-like permease family protein [Acidobacteriota bacterium]
AALALLLAAFGVYGLLSYTVAQRRSEIGIRMALGATRGNIVALVVGQGALLVAAGTVAGMLGAAASSRLIESFLVGVEARDALTLSAAPLLLVGVAFVACWLPARRATRIDPMEALRVE